LPHVHPSRPPGATAWRGGRSPVLAEREASSTQVPEEEGVELRRTADGKGDGVLATRPFAAGETVMVGFLVGAPTGNGSHATQVGPGRLARHGGLGPKVNHSLLVLAVEAEALVGDLQLEVLAHPEAVPDRAGGQPDLVAAA